MFALWCRFLIKCFSSGTIISNFYGSTEMMDVTFETFSSFEDVQNVLLNDKIPIGIYVMGFYIGAELWKLTMCPNLNYMFVIG